MKWINATHLKRWALERDCQENLPLLIRKLIRATSSKIDNILFPSGDSVVYGGWDGILEASSGTEYIPEGVSLWEFGTEKTISKKANEDYNKRRLDPLNYQHIESTFVFVTPYHWSGKNKWIESKKKEKCWKDVIVYDAEYLEEWIEQAPAVGSWLAKYLEIYPDGVRAIEDFWSEWICNPKHNITPKLVTSGREIAAKSIESWCFSNPSLLQMKASSQEEALAFFCATVQQLEWQQKEDILSRALLVDDEKSFRTVLSSKSPLYLVIYFGNTSAINKAVINGHHVFNPIGADRTYKSDVISLPRMNRDGFISSLVEMGFSEDNARKYSKESGRSLSVLRRILQYDYNQPKWAKRETARILIPLLLAGRWNDNYLGDKETLAELSGQPYENFIANIQAWTLEPDSPVYKIGNKWRLVSPIDAWSALAPFITREDILRFEQLIDRALIEEEEFEESIFNLPIFGSHVRRANHYSYWLKEGICNSIIIISVFGQDYQLNAIDNYQLWSDKVVRKILNRINEKSFFSVNRLLPKLAEASPSSFLDAVEYKLRSKENILKVFDIEISYLFSNNNHTSLLFALEMLAWEEAYLSRVSNILLILAKHDPGIKIANKPLNSLHYIFLPWYPQTFASYEDRVSIIRLMTAQEKDTAWPLLVSLLPKTRDTGWLNAKFRWRQSIDNSELVITYNELFDFCDFITTIIIENINGDGKRLAEVIEHLGSLPPDNRKLIIDYILQTDIINTNVECLTNEMRRIIVHHREFSEEDWALPADDLDRIENAYDIYISFSDTIKYSSLFNSDWPSLMGLSPTKIRDDNYYYLQLYAQRVRALIAIYSKGGVEAIIEFSRNTTFPFFIGVSTAYINLSIIEEDRILNLLPGEDNLKDCLEKGYIAEMSRIYGQEWVTVTIDRLSSYNNEKIASFLLSLTFENNKLWTLVSSYNQEVIDMFWQKHTIKVYDSPTEEKLTAFNQLLKYGRFKTAIHYAYLMKEMLPSSLIYEILEKTATQPSSIFDLDNVNSHNVHTIYEYLLNSGEIEESRLAILEWYYISFFNNKGGTKLLYKSLAEDPSFFQVILTFTCKPSPESGIVEDIDESNEEFIKNRALSAYNLLTSWNVLPGTTESGEIDSLLLKDWVNIARDLCYKVGRLEKANYYIGHLFGSSQPYNGYWPQDAVCDIIEDSCNEKMNSGFTTAIFNKRGTILKVNAEGGTQEKQISDQYKQYAKRTLSRWPRVSALLETISNSYELQSKEEDIDATENDLEN